MIILPILITSLIHFLFKRLGECSFWAQERRVNPVTPQSDQFQIPPAASPEILDPTVWRTWLICSSLTQMKDDYTTSPRMYFLKLAEGKGYAEFSSLRNYYIVRHCTVLQPSSTERYVSNVANDHMHPTFFHDRMCYSSQISDDGRRTVCDRQELFLRDWFLRRRNDFLGRRECRDVI